MFRRSACVPPDGRGVSRHGGYHGPRPACMAAAACALWPTGSCGLACPAQACEYPRTPSASTRLRAHPGPAAALGSPRQARTVRAWVDRCAAGWSRVAKTRSEKGGARRAASKETHIRASAHTQARKQTQPHSHTLTPARTSTHTSVRTQTHPHAHNHTRAHNHTNHAHDHHTSTRTRTHTHPHAHSIARHAIHCAPRL